MIEWQTHGWRIPDTYSSDTVCWPAARLCPSQLPGTGTKHPLSEKHLITPKTILFFSQSLNKTLNPSISRSFNYAAADDNDQLFYLNYQLQWRLNVFAIDLLLLRLIFILIGPVRGRRPGSWWGTCRPSWHTQLSQQRSSKVPASLVPVCFPEWKKRNVPVTVSPDGRGFRCSVALKCSSAALKLHSRLKKHASCTWVCVHFEFEFQLWTSM